MVYIDILIIEDLIMNYIVLLSTSLILNRRAKFKRIFISSLIGTIPLISLFLKLNKSLISILNIIFSIIMSLITFKYKNILYTFRNILYMYFVSIFLAGSIYLINTNFLPKINNYILSVILLITISPIITFIYITSLKKLKNNYSNYYKIDIYLKDKPKITVMSFLDTGNQLIDPYFHKPIILISKKIIDIKKEKTILVPYKTIDNNNLLKCFSPQKIYIDKIGTIKNVMIGIIDKVDIKGIDCILNPKVIERIK